MEQQSQSQEEEEEEEPRAPFSLPISYPSDGTITQEWVTNLMNTFNYASYHLPPSQFHTILPIDHFVTLILAASSILKKEKNYVCIDDLDGVTEVVVVGDVHGQLHDVMFLLGDAGFPGEDRVFVFNGDYVDRGAWGLETFLLLLAWKIPPFFFAANAMYMLDRVFVFNGNYVDRGAWGLETFLLLLAWKVLMPHRVYLLRGNHESQYCTQYYGFEKEVMAKYGDKGKRVYAKCLRCFEELPLASIIAGKVYTSHGGLFRKENTLPPRRSKGKKNRKIIEKPETKTLSLGSLDGLLKARRFVLNPPHDGENLIPGDVLWSDPSMNPGLSPNKERGIGLIWGPDCTEEFLKKYNLKLIIRSHEGPDAREKRSGMGGMDEGYTIDHVVESGKLITLFSAPDYPQFQATEDRYRNKGAYIVLKPPDFDSPVFHSFEAVTPRPKANPYYDFEDVLDSDEELDFASMTPAS